MIKNDISGRLIFLSTPIGNLADITFRAIKILKEASLIAAEDTRRANILLKHYEISVPTTSYHQNNEKQKSSYLIKAVKEGKTVIVISDAGTPCLSDPGYLLTQHAIRENIEIEIVPGVSALTFAIVASSMPVNNFYFVGFLPQKKGKRASTLKGLKGLQTTLFIYESPYRISKLLNEIVDVFGEYTKVVLIREATKLYEEIIRGSAGLLLKDYKEKNWKGEFVVAVNTRQHKIADDNK